MIKRSWIEIDLHAVQQNYRICRRCIPAEAEIMAVVKADAYGHGEDATARALAEAGCRHFAVSNIEEAEALRRAGITGSILILGYTPPECAERLLQSNITQALLSADYAERLADRGIAAQFALDTGMNRIGLDADSPADCEAVIRAYAPRYRLNGLFTHLCVADTPAQSDFTEEQLKKFEAVVSRVADLQLPFVHCMNSAGSLWHRPVGNIYRLGIVLYGLKPDITNTLPEGIQPALTWKSVVSMLKTVHPGETVGYGRSYTADREITVATVPTGYADGYSRALSNRGFVLVRGVRCPIIGKVCMDQFMVDVTAVPHVAFEDEVTLVGAGLDADEVGAMAGTIGYEIICDISKRVSRVYLP